MIGGTGRATREAYGRLNDADAVMIALRSADALTSDELFKLMPELDAGRERVLLALDDLDLALVAEIDSRRAGLDRLERLAEVTTWFLGLLGIGAVFSVARLTTAEQRARVEAEAAVRTRDGVVSVVSHDLRNPLSTITLASDLLLETTAEEPGRNAEHRQLELIRRAANSMNRMIEDLLDIARIESGELRVERVRVPAAALLGDAYSMLEPIIGRAGQHLVLRAPEQLPAVHADRDRVLQVLSNLVGNATKFTPSGGTITLGAEAAPGRVWFIVSDTGAGIPPENIPHLFDRFWQASRTDRRGLGLGLPIVRGLVEAHGGVIEVESEVGRGSTFRFSVERA